MYSCSNNDYGNNVNLEIYFHCNLFQKISICLLWRVCLCESPPQPSKKSRFNSYLPCNMFAFWDRPLAPFGISKFPITIVGVGRDIFWGCTQHSITFIRWSTLASSCVLIDSRQYNLSPGWAIKRCANSLWNMSTAHLQANQFKHDCYNTSGAIATGKLGHFSLSLFLSFDCLVFINTLNT